jgi:radical SAM superfamily enzyme YgiQ (UPF0313 family)
MNRPLRVMIITPPATTMAEPYTFAPPYARNALAFLAGWLRQFPGFEIQLLDAKFERLDFKQTLQRVADFAPDVVGLTAFTTEIKPAAYLATCIKRFLPHATTVVGGPHATALPKATLRQFPGFDVVVAGEGEITFQELCEAIRDGRSFGEIHGLAYRDGSQICLTPSRQRILDQDSIPVPAWDMLPPAAEYFVQTTRGCPFSCVFCMNHNGRVARKRSVELVMQELETILSIAKPNRIRFGDEIFTVDIPRTAEMCDAMIERGMQQKFSWDCLTHARFVNYELFKKMKAAGCDRADIGVETGDDSTLRSIGKGTTREMIFASAEAARRAGVKFGMLLIIGHPNETRESLNNSIKMAIALNPDIPFVSTMQPFPGTEISRLAAANEGGYRLTSCDWDEFNMRISNVLEFVNFSRREIFWLQLMTIVKVFLYNHRYLDLAKFGFSYWRAGLAVLQRTINPNPSARERFPLRPADYEEVLAGGEPFDPRELIQAREEWADWQVSEVKRTRRDSPELMQLTSR